MFPFKPLGKKTPWWVVAVGDVPVTMARIWEGVRPQPRALTSVSARVVATLVAEDPSSATMVVCTPISSAIVPMKVVVVAPPGFASEERAAEIACV